MIAISTAYPAVNKISHLLKFWESQTGIKNALQGHTFFNDIVNDFFEGSDKTKQHVITGITAAANELKTKKEPLNRELKNYLAEKQKWQDKQNTVRGLNLNQTFRDLEIKLRNIPYGFIL
jgi:hypothetical protein